LQAGEAQGFHSQEWQAPRARQAGWPNCDSLVQLEAEWRCNSELVAFAGPITMEPHDGVVRRNSTLFSAL
jgi:hypothetical protein